MRQFNSESINMINSESMRKNDQFGEGSIYVRIALANSGSIMHVQLTSSHRSIEEEEEEAIDVYGIPD